MTISQLLDDLITSSKSLASYEQIMELVGNVTDEKGFKMSQNIQDKTLRIKRLKSEILAIAKEQV